MNAEERQFEMARSLFREANDAFFLFDPVTQLVLDLNPAAQRLTGLEKHLACKMSLSELFFSKGSGDLDRLAMALNRTGFFHSREGYYLHKASAALPVNISVSRIHTEPEPVGLVVARDISDRKRALEALGQAEARYHSLAESTGVVGLGAGRQGGHCLAEPGVRDHYGLAAGRLDRPPVQRADSPRRHRRRDGSARAGHAR